MKIGLLGAGRIGAFHARTLANIPDVEHLAIGDADEARAAAVAEQVGGAAAPIAEVLRSGLDAVVIAAATTAHAELIHASLDQRLPVFCEKPLARSLAETEAIVDRVESSGAILQVGFQRRFDAGYTEAHRVVHTGELGRLYLVRIAGHDPYPPPESYFPTSGGIYQDLHIHDLDVLRWVSGGEVLEVYAQGAVLGFEMIARYSDVDTAATLLTMADGALVVMTGSRHNPRGYDIRMELYGSKDSIAVGMDARTPIRSVEPGAPAPAEPGYPDFMVRFGAAYRAELAHFLKLARGAAENRCTARDALEAFRIALACDRSRAEHRPVRVASGLGS